MGKMRKTKKNRNPYRNNINLKLLKNDMTIMNRQEPNEIKIASYRL